MRIWCASMRISKNRRMASPNLYPCPPDSCDSSKCFDSFLDTSCKTGGAGSAVQAIMHKLEKHELNGPEAEVKTVTIYSPHTKTGSGGQLRNFKVFTSFNLLRAPSLDCSSWQNHILHFPDNYLLLSPYPSPLATGLWFPHQKQRPTCYFGGVHRPKHWRRQKAGFLPQRRSLRGWNLCHSCHGRKCSAGVCRNKSLWK